MPRHGFCRLDVGDGEHEFNLAPLKQLTECEEKCGAGIAVIHARLGERLFHAHDIYEPIRLGRIGAGAKPEDVIAFMRNYVYERPLMELRNFAFVIVGAVLVGVADDNDFLKKKPRAARRRRAAESK